VVDNDERDLIVSNGLSEPVQCLRVEVPIVSLCRAIVRGGVAVQTENINVSAPLSERELAYSEAFGERGWCETIVVIERRV
jgi:hypothetical protein